MERVGYLLDEKDIIKRIQNFSKDASQIKFYKKQSLSRTVWIYKDPVENKEYLVVYDKPRKEVVTVIPYINKKKGKCNANRIQS